jgi:hypothetical protein
MIEQHCSNKSKSRTKKYTCLTKKDLANILKTANVKTPFKNNTKKDVLYSILTNELKDKTKESDWWKKLPTSVDKKIAFSMKYLLYKVKNGKNLKKWLSSEEITKIIYQNIKMSHDHFYGCFSADYFKKTILNIRPNTGLIFNTSKSSEKGKHWVAVYFDEDETLNYFDPLGNPPSGDILQFIKRIPSKKVIINKTKYQYIDGTCGDFCCVYLIDKINSCTSNLDEKSVNISVRTKMMHI